MQYLCQVLGMIHKVCKFLTKFAAGKMIKWEASGWDNRLLLSNLEQSMKKLEDDGKTNSIRSGRRCFCFPPHLMCVTLSVWGCGRNSTSAPLVYLKVLAD